MDQIKLRVESRDILGKKVRFLRRQGIIPVHVYGHGVESRAVQCEGDQLRRALSAAGHSRLISLNIDEDPRPRNVFVGEVQRDPRTGDYLHIDLLEVRMGVNVQVEVPVVLVGEAPASKIKANLITQELDTLTVEAFPMNIPPQVEVDISSLTEAEQAIHVRDLGLGPNARIMDDPELTVVRVTATVAEGEAEAAEEEGEEE